MKGVRRLCKSTFGVPQCDWDTLVILWFACQAVAVVGTGHLWIVVAVCQGRWETGEAPEPASPQKLGPDDAQCLLVGEFTSRHSAIRAVGSP